MQNSIRKTSTIPFSVGFRKQKYYYTYYLSTSKKAYPDRQTDTHAQKTDNYTPVTRQQSTDKTKIKLPFPDHLSSRAYKKKQQKAQQHDFARSTRQGY